MPPKAVMNALRVRHKALRTRQKLLCSVVEKLVIRGEVAWDVYGVHVTFFERRLDCFFFGSCGREFFAHSGALEFRRFDTLALSL